MRMGCEMAAQILQAVVVSEKSGRVQCQCPADELGQAQGKRVLVAAQGAALHLLPVQNHRQVAPAEKRHLQDGPVGEQPAPHRGAPRGATARQQNKGLQLIRLPAPPLTALAQQVAQFRTRRRTTPDTADSLAVTAGTYQPVEED